MLQRLEMLAITRNRTGEDAKLWLLLSSPDVVAERSVELIFVSLKTKETLQHTEVLVPLVGVWFWLRRHRTFTREKKEGGREDSLLLAQQQQQQCTGAVYCCCTADGGTAVCVAPPSQLLFTCLLGGGMTIYAK